MILLQRQMIPRYPRHLLIMLTLLLPQLSILFCVKAAPEENFQWRGRVLNAVEHVSVFYRVVVTTPIWLVWFHQGYPFRFFMTCETPCSDLQTPITTATSMQ